MIIRELSCIFLHSVKTAGTSVEKWLCGPQIAYPPADGSERLFGYDADRNIFLQHATAAVARDLVGEETFWRCYRFSVVRNPFSRVLSMWFYNNPKREARFGTFETMLRALPELVAAATPSDYYFLPQTAYTHLDGAPCCDAVVRLEDLPDSLEPVAAHLGIGRPLPFLNVSRHPQRGSRPPASFYTPETAQIVAEAYAGDFTAFGYSTDVRRSNAGAEPSPAMASAGR